MKRTVLTLLILASTLLLGSASAQLPIFESKKAEAAILKYNQGGPNQAIVNHFLVRLSSGANVPVDRARIIIAHDVVLRITRVDQYHMQVYAALENFLVEGETSYKGFDMAEFLRPTAIKFNLKLMSGLNKFKREWPFQEVAIGGDPAPIANFRQVDSTNFRLDKLHMTNKAFIYKAASQALFDSRISLIDEYYQADAELGVLYDQLLALHPEDLEALPQMDAQLGQLESRIQNIASKNYEQQLNLGPQQDPVNFVPRFADVMQLAGQLRQQVTANLAQLPALFYQRGMDKLANGNLNAAVSDFNESLRLDPGFAPAFFQLTKMDYDAGKIDLALPSLLRILREMNPDPNTRAASLQLLEDYQQRTVAGAKIANDRGAFQDALNLLDPTFGLCNEFPALNCHAKFDYEVTRAHQGMYKALLADARKALDQGQLKEAENAAQAAVDFHLAHKSSIPDGVDAERAIDEVHRRMYNKMLSDAGAFLNQGQPEAADPIVLDAIAFQQSHSRAIPSARLALQLQDRVNQGRYQKLVATGRSELSAKRWAASLRSLESALALEGNWGIVADPAVFQDARSAARGVALDKFREGASMAKNNRLADARRLTTEATGLVDKYDHGSDPEIMQLKDSLQGAIFNQECMNAQSRFNGIVAEAEGHRSMRKFIDADLAYDRAIQAARESNACNIDQGPAMAGKRDISSAAAYQRKMQDVYKKVERAMYRDAIQGFQDAGRNFQSAQLSDMGLSHSSLFDFIQGSGRFEFIIHGAHHFMDVQQLEESLSLLRYLAQRGYPKSRTKSAQIRLGQELAMRDKPQDPGGNAKAKALTYTRGDKALKFVYKAFVKHWKKI